MRKYSKIIFVGESGNSRTPIATEILRKLMVKQSIEIIAKGIVVLFPEPLNQKAEAIMISNGLPTEGFMSSQLEREDIDENTLVLVLSKKQKEKVMERFVDVVEEDIQVLTELVGDELEIIDPYGGTLQAYGLCYETLSQSIRKLVKLLNEGE